MSQRLVFSTKQVRFLAYKCFAIQQGHLQTYPQLKFFLDMQSGTVYLPIVRTLLPHNVSKLNAGSKKFEN